MDTMLRVMIIMDFIQEVNTKIKRKTPNNPNFLHLLVEEILNGQHRQWEITQHQTTQNSIFLKKPLKIIIKWKALTAF